MKCVGVDEHCWKLRRPLILSKRSQIKTLKSGSWGERLELSEKKEPEIGINYTARCFIIYTLRPTKLGGPEDGKWNGRSISHRSKGHVINAYKFAVERDSWGTRGSMGNAIKTIINKLVVGAWTGFIWPRTGTCFGSLWTLWTRSHSCKFNFPWQKGRDIFFFASLATINNTMYIIMCIFTYTCSQKHNNLSDSITM
jgi:hypothetical protein